MLRVGERWSAGTPRTAIDITRLLSSPGCPGKDTGDRAPTGTKIGDRSLGCNRFSLRVQQRGELLDTVHQPRARTRPGGVRVHDMDGEVVQAVDSQRRREVGGQRLAPVRSYPHGATTTTSGCAARAAPR